MILPGCRGIKSCIMRHYFEVFRSDFWYNLPMQSATKPTEKQSLISEPEVSELLQIIQQKDRVIARQQQLLELLEEKLRLSKIKRFGASSEKLSYQKGLFDETELETAFDELEQQFPEQEEAVKPSPKKRKKRDGFSDKLPRVRIELPLSEEEKAGATQTFFTKVKEELDIIPAKAQVLEYWQEKAVFETGNNETGQTILAAQRPFHPLGKCMASTSLLAYVITAKYADSLPLYRLEQIIKRHGASISRTTMAHWIIRLEDTFKPLLNLMHEHQLSSDYLQMDETRIQVLKETGHVATSDKWMWVIRGGPPQQPVVLFNYDASRGKEVPLRLLDGFQGYLQVDGYYGYNQACTQYHLERIGCMDHARRKFVEASKAANTSKKTRKVSKADVAIGKLRKLYLIEDKIKALTPEQKYQQRQKLSKPLLNELHDWLQENITRVPRDSLTGKAISYTLNQWEYLIGYLKEGRLNISNALAENAVRPFAVGRRNWLFADTSRGAKASATCYSLIETAKANGLEPFDYIRYVLQHIAQARTVEDFEALLPWNMK